MMSSRQIPPSVALCLSPKFHGFFCVGPSNFWLTLILAVLFITVATVTGICAACSAICQKDRRTQAIVCRAQQGEEAPPLGGRSLRAGTPLAPSHQDGAPRLRSFLPPGMQPPTNLHQFSGTSLSTFSCHLTSRPLSCIVGRMFSVLWENVTQCGAHGRRVRCTPRP